MKTKLNGLAFIVATGLLMAFTSCRTLQTNNVQENKYLPESFNVPADSINSGLMSWRQFFKDTCLLALIDTALKKNQELKIFQQELQIAKNEVLVRKAAYLPFANVGATIGADKFSRYTTAGSFDAINDIIPGKKAPEPMPNFTGIMTASWEIDVWKKLRNARSSAAQRFYASMEGRNFLVTNLVTEIAESYYDLLALDNQLTILKSTIDLYNSSLEIVRLEKLSARVTELAVRRFEAEVYKNQSKVYYLNQQIVETQNKLNYLIGHYPQAISRISNSFLSFKPDSLHSGVPTQLLGNRPDVRMAENELAAAKLDVKVARAQFYPGLVLTAAGGLSSFNAAYLLKTPQALLLNMAGAVFAPIINRKMLKANLFTADAKKQQAITVYERTLLNAYTEIVTQIANIQNLQKSFDLKNKQVNTLKASIDISSNLFTSARADYMEVLLTQRDALDSKFELVETKKQQINAMINLYRALGGGWH